MKLSKWTLIMAVLWVVMLSTGRAASNLAIVVNSNLQPLIQTNLDQYVADVTAEGYTPIVRTWNLAASDQNEPSELRTYLQSVSNQLVGAVFIGDLPIAQYENFNDFYGLAQFPFDLYYMDLAVTWQNTNNNNYVDGPSTTGINPTIWVSRIKCSGMTTFSGYNEAALVNRYLAKVHRFRQGELRLPDRALLWADSDWNYYIPGWTTGAAYTNTTRVSDEIPGIITDTIDWQGRYRHAYETEFFMCHSSESVHAPSPNNINSAEVAAADICRLFWNCWNCSAADYTYGNYIAGVRLYTPRFGLIVVGTTKTGAMGNASPFYTYLNQGKCHGEAFKLWFASNYSSVEWHRGMVLLGDGTLRLGRFAQASVPGNNAPTISPIADVVTDEDVTSAPVLFTVGDTLTPASNLLVWAESSNREVFPSTQITLSGTNESRSMTFRGLSNANGTTTVSVTVCDGILMTSNSFLATVQPVNDKPTCILDPNANNDVIMASATLGLKATTSDADGNSTVTGVTFKVDGVSLAGIKQDDTTFTNQTGVLAAGSYVITANSYDNTGAKSTTASTTVLALNPLPAGWTNSPMGTPTYAGAAGVDINGAIVVAGCAEIGGTYDRGHFAWRAMTGNADLITQVTSVELNENESKAGLMIRATLDTGSPYVYAKIKPSGPQARLQYRAMAGSNTVLRTETGTLTFPRWLRLVKSNDVFLAYHGTNGVQWILFDTITNAMPTTFYAGLATAGYLPGETCTAIYQNTKLQQDSDCDGLPDDWEIANGTDPLTNDAETDADGDGFTAFQEYLAGTCPSDPSSVLRVGGVEPTGPDMVIQFPTVFGKLYRVERCDDLAASNCWTMLQDNIAGTGEMIQVTDPGAAAQTKRFYRVRLLTP